MRRAPSLTVLIAASALLMASFWLGLETAKAHSPTFDEGFYIVRGWGYLRSGELLPNVHPPLTQALAGLGVLLEPGLPDPQTLDGWLQGEIEAVSRDFLWRRSLNTARIVYLARLPGIGLQVLLCALLFRWGRSLYGDTAGLLATGLAAFSPNLIAHAAQATSDLGVAVFYVASIYTWSEFLRRPRRGWLIAAGLSFGLAQASKLSALLLIPTMGLMALAVAWQRPIAGLGLPGLRRDSQKRIARLGQASLASVYMGLIGVFSLWACYGFDLRPYPLSNYLYILFDFLNLTGIPRYAYFMGQFSLEGWRLYHPAAYLLKTPLSELLLLALASASVTWHRLDRREWALIFPGLLYLGFSMASSINVGLRYLLPILPLIALFSARVAGAGFKPAPAWTRHGASRHLIDAAGVQATVIAVALGGGALALGRFHPHYLAYFNLLAGDYQSRVSWLADSNLDWGQDLPAVAAYQRDAGLDSIYLSYFGQADPAYYGIRSEAIPGWPPPYPAPTFNPLRPEPGVYVIGASNLAGIQSLDYDALGFFRAREPDALIGQSMGVYEIESEETLTLAAGEGWLGQCSVPAVTENIEAIRLLTGLPELQDQYFDCTSSLFFHPGPGWLLLPAGRDAVAALGEPDYLARYRDGSPKYSVWIAEAPPAPASTVIAPEERLPIALGNVLALQGYTVRQDAGGIVVTAWWQVLRPPEPPVSIFAHLSAADGFTAASGDALGLPAEAWLAGTLLIQEHRFDTTGLNAGSYTIRLGLYHILTGERFTTAEGADAITLMEIEVP